ncbi:MAG: YHYH protein, partial [Bacteroidota bacterium]
MKTLRLISFLMMATIIFTACDEDDPCVETVFYEDADNDGLGNAESTLSACELPDGYVENANDNDDTQAIAEV